MNDYMHINSTTQMEWIIPLENTNNHDSPNMKYLNNQINNLNSPITIKEIEVIILKPSPKKYLNQFHTIS